MIRVNVGASEVRIRVVGVVVKISGVEVGVSGIQNRKFQSQNFRVNVRASLGSVGICGISIKGCRV